MDTARRTVRGSPALLLLLLGTVRIDGYRPVVIVHGIFDGPKQFKTLSQFITEMHPGTEVSVIDLYDNLHSLRSLWTQVQDFRKALDAITLKAPDGVHLLCFSQGGLICRALLSLAPRHNVHAFVSLSSPLSGQYGDTDYLRWLFPSFIKNKVFRVCYSSVGQKVSVCDYWNDPHQRYRYLQSNTFLPMLNGERPHLLQKEWRENFLLIKKLVLIGGPDDGVITPWQSSHFGFYDIDENIVEMRNQEFYKSDRFGLKTLAARGDVSVCVRSGVKHVEWHSNRTVFTGCIERWLT
ncbi:lysosomal thioesterase PPT2-like [Pseudoliparis swirei]|uniref:lysosomal thioesterase PPT2-like n=1 Tax=Pseudoliparis swirei TaxID=2059687 RepID=UPI0024BDAE87|nr:lysosomal thioesterase PPT2-like [Pseudoliparis swirei]